MTEVIGFDAPDRVIGRRIAEFATQPRDDGGAVGQAFQTIAVVRAHAGEIEVVRMSARMDVAELRMHQFVQGTAVHHQAATDAGADGDVHQRVERCAVRAATCDLRPAPHTDSANAAALTSVSSAIGMPSAAKGASRSASCQPGFGVRNRRPYSGALGSRSSGPKLAVSSARGGP